MNQEYMREVLEYYEDGLEDHTFLTDLKQLLSAKYMSTVAASQPPQADFTLFVDGESIECVGTINGNDINGVVREVVKLIAARDFNGLANFSMDSKTGAYNGRAVHIDGYGVVSTLPVEANHILGISHA